MKNILHLPLLNSRQQSSFCVINFPNDSVRMCTNLPACCLVVEVLNYLPSEEEGTCLRRSGTRFQGKTNGNEDWAVEARAQLMDHVVGLTFCWPCCTVITCSEGIASARRASKNYRQRGRRTGWRTTCPAIFSCRSIFCRA